MPFLSMYVPAMLQCMATNLVGDLLFVKVYIDDCCTIIRGEGCSCFLMIVRRRDGVAGYVAIR